MAVQMALLKGPQNGNNENSFSKLNIKSDDISKGSLTGCHKD